MKKSTARRYGGLDDQLEKTEERLTRYLAMDDEKRRFIEEMGVTRLTLDKEITRLEKLIAKRDAKKSR